MALSAFLRSALLRHYLKESSYTQPTNIFFSLHTADPGTTGASEVAGGSYARQNANSVWASESGGSKSTNVNVDFASMPAVTVTHVGVWDASTSGNFLVGGPLAASKVVNSGDTFRLTSGGTTASMT
jgi:hypothetical protein